MNQPFISCICPTYKRPKLLQNVLACYLAQDYLSDKCELIILDDAGQFIVQTGLPRDKEWSLYQSERYYTLPDKFNALVDLISPEENQIVVIWEDDDVYLPWHLSAIGKAHVEGKPQFFTLSEVYSNYDKPMGQVRKEAAAGRFHAHWAFSRELFDELGGYPKTSSLNYDQIMGAKLRNLAGGETHYTDSRGPSYVYRWGNGIYHGSQAGEQGYEDLWRGLENMPSPWIGKLVAEFDEETRIIYREIGKWTEK